MKSRRKWGRWTYDPTGAYRSLDIQPYPENTALYQVPCWPEGCNFQKFTEWLGHWVQHLQVKKGWITATDLWNFVDAAQDLYRG